MGGAWWLVPGHRGQARTASCCPSQCGKCVCGGGRVSRELCSGAVQRPKDTSRRTSQEHSELGISDPIARVRETEAYKAYVSCPISHSQKAVKPKLQTQTREVTLWPPLNVTFQEKLPPAQWHRQREGSSTHGM